MTETGPGEAASRRRSPSLETLFIAVLALLGLRLGLRPLGDNSLFVHIRTGIDIVDGLGIPRVDPYSFTASGEPWVVQSWLASVMYGVIHTLAGFDGLVILHGVLYAALVTAIGAMARTGSALRTAAATALLLAVSAGQWSPRWRCRRAPGRPPACGCATPATRRAR